MNLCTVMLHHTLVSYTNACLESMVDVAIKKEEIHFEQRQKNGKRKVQGVPQSQTAALPRPQEEEEADKSKQTQTEQTYEKH